MNPRRKCFSDNLLRFVGEDVFISEEKDNELEPVKLDMNTNLRHICQDRPGKLGALFNALTDLLAKENH